MKTDVFRSSLIGLPRTLKKLFAIAHDCLAIFLSVWISFGLRLDQWMLFQENYWVVYSLALLLAIPLFYLNGLYEAIFRYIGSAAMVSMARLFFVYSLIFFLIFSIVGVENIPRSIGVIQPIVLCIWISFSRYQLRLWLVGSGIIDRFFRNKKSFVLIYGAGLAGRELANVLKLNPSYLIKGFVDENSIYQGQRIDGIKVYGSNELYEVILRLKITVVFLALPELKKARKFELIDHLQKCNVRVRTPPSVDVFTSPSNLYNNLPNIEIDDLLGRESVLPMASLLKKNIEGKTVLVTGAGGSIGSELCRQIIQHDPKSIVLIENSEFSLYKILDELETLKTHVHNSKSYVANLRPILQNSTKIYPILGSVLNRNLILKIFRKYKPDTVYHAAAYKHVPLVESNPEVGLKNNIWGTLYCAQASLDAGVSNFVLVSTDKAVRPTNIMGASKRIAELVLQAIADDGLGKQRVTKFCMVRFGNVLGSSGSVVPLFNSQIRAGGPITLTHPEVTRFFMTIPEAAQLVIQASAMSVGGDVFVLDMGKPIRIHELAKRMIFLSGLLVKDQMNPDGDIEIKITGLRPGEKLYEELLIGGNPSSTDHSKIMRANEGFIPWAELEHELMMLNEALLADDQISVRQILSRLAIGYSPPLEATYQ